MATDIEIVKGVFENKTLTELETPKDTSATTQGSNYIKLTVAIVNFVLGRLKAGRTPREILKLVKKNHPQNKSISRQQLAMILRARREIYAQKYAAANPVVEAEPVK